MTPANGESVQTWTLSFPSLASPTRGSLCRHLGRALDPRSPASVHIYFFYLQPLPVSWQPQSAGSPEPSCLGGSGWGVLPDMARCVRTLTSLFRRVHCGSSKAHSPVGQDSAVPSSFTLCDDATSRPRQSSQSWLVDLGASPPLLSFLSSMHI